MEPSKADIKYQHERARLIPHATRYADEQVGETCPGGNRDVWNRKWNTTFLGKMDELVKEEGLWNT